MNDRFFLDTNLFVYSLEESEPRKSARARELIRHAIVTGKGVVSYQVVQEFLNVALRRFSTPLLPFDAEHYVSTVFRPLLAVHSSISLYVEALRLQSRSGLAWYDSLIVASALESGCAALYTEDLQHGQMFKELRVQNPFL